ncbi:hypothetical protein [Marinifilum flexuosum]|uniref:hypothetical protein n=1 Tax=Marinifilum flexuosum TaxID=1117708 RepID=UPI00249345CD|nr:hypothetical protein [Marinifilum flexuosum]
MSPNDIYKYSPFSNEFSVDDWNELISVKLRKYFSSDELFNSNKEFMRTEILNYIQFSTKQEYLDLFNWTFSLFKDCLEKDENLSIAELVKLFPEISETDMRWMSNVLLQADVSNSAERDKINYSFKMIDEILEGFFKIRFKLLHKFACFKVNGMFPDNSNSKFGNLINNFPSELSLSAQLFLKDPIISISTSQWRNIASHKSFIIEKDFIKLEYGHQKIKTATIDYNQFYKILNWVQNIYHVLRLCEVLIHFNYGSVIKEKLGGTSKIKIRFESYLVHIIHNLQVVGFEFVSKLENDKTFELNLRKKQNDDVKNSVIHASQCLDQLSCAISDDEFIKEKYNRTKVNIVDEKSDILASASIDVEIALSKAENKISLEEYINNIDFKINN